MVWHRFINSFESQHFVMTLMTWSDWFINESSDIRRDLCIAIFTLFPHFSLIFCCSSYHFASGCLASLFYCRHFLFNSERVTMVVCLRVKLSTQFSWKMIVVPSTGWGWCAEMRARTQLELFLNILAGAQECSQSRRHLESLPIPSLNARKRQLERTRKRLRNKRQLKNGKKKIFQREEQWIRGQ